MKIFRQMVMVAILAGAVFVAAETASAQTYVSTWPTPTVSVYHPSYPLVANYYPTTGYVPTYTYGPTYVYRPAYTPYVYYPQTYYTQPYYYARPYYNTWRLGWWR